MISACFTVYNRTNLLFEAVEPFLLDHRVSEVIISDDHSDDSIYQSIVWKYNGIDKVKIFRNEVNMDCNKNKMLAVTRATNEYVLILDSDNIFSKSFLDAIDTKERTKDLILCPAFAKPHFDFRAIAGTYISSKNVGSLLNTGNCSTMLNAMNYFVNREEYLKVWDSELDPVTSDSIYQNYNWLKAGNSIYVVPGMEYEHRIHEGSHYQRNVRRTPAGFHDSIINKLKAMQ